MRHKQTLYFGAAQDTSIENIPPMHDVEDEEDEVAHCLRWAILGRRIVDAVIVENTIQH